MLGQFAARAGKANLHATHGRLCLNNPPRFLDGPIDAALTREALGLAEALDTTPAGRSLPSLLEDYERELVRAELERAGGVVAKAARALGVERTTLTRRLRQLGLRS